ncbi:putative regulatory protein, FmdB family [Desulfatibacillum alkenivorans DSM 16219]|uniref:Putative regulatory protein, FmdB family n=2 Tax=Desulfatibacillum alkenivorans TaxID=259354 RepID=A0A1M6S164_9BACT|nr:putative regulatory protein, FmdB family [Desulfatibacillum alkenivorans DSM 16219]
MGLIRRFVMPIYEFKCMECNEVFEVLCVNSDDTVAMECKKCQSPNIERIMSSTNFAMGSGGGPKSSMSSETRNCSSGSCTTYNVPGVD